MIYNDTDTAGTAYKSKRSRGMLLAAKSKVGTSMNIVEDLNTFDKSIG